MDTYPTLRSALAHHAEVQLPALPPNAAKENPALALVHREATRTRARLDKLHKPLLRGAAKQDAGVAASVEDLRTILSVIEEMSRMSVLVDALHRLKNLPTHKTIADLMDLVPGLKKQISEAQRRARRAK